MRMRRQSASGWRWVALVVALWPCACLAGVELERGEIQLLEISTLAAEAELLKQSGIADPSAVVVALALPRDFEPGRRYPILFTSVTGDPYQSNVKELEVYREIALARGWIVLTGQAKPWPDRSRDTTNGRRASAWAAVRALGELIPQSQEWPLAFAGFSGGAKTSQLLAADFLARGRSVVGVLMAGCNEELSIRAIREYGTDPEDLAALRYFLSSGTRDTLSTPRQVRAVRRSLENRGATHVRLETYDNRHRFYRPHLAEALAWFEEGIEPYEACIASASSRAAAAG